MGYMRIAYKILVGKTEGKRLLGRPRHTLKNNIEMQPKRDGIGRYGLDSFG
jgi:hypothetical protein